MLFTEHFTEVIVFSEKPISKGPLKYLTKTYSKNNPCDSLGGLLQTRRLTNLIHPDPEVKVGPRPRTRPAPFPELGFKAQGLRHQGICL